MFALLNTIYSDETVVWQPFLHEIFVSIYYKEHRSHLKCESLVQFSETSKYIKDNVKTLREKVMILTVSDQLTRAFSEAYLTLCFCLSFSQCYV